MPTKHPIVDKDDIRLEVDLITRAITMIGNSPKKVILIKGDTNSERFTFKIPRHIEGHDVMDTNVRRIHFINTEASTRKQYKGIYDIVDITPFPDDPDNYVTGTWLISNEATQAVGLLAFTLQLGCTEEFESIEGEMQIRYQYSWNTSPFTGITIGDGINNAPAIVDEYIDILETWWHRLYASSELPIEIHTLQSFEALGGDTEPDTLYLIEDDPAIAMLESHDAAIGNHETRLAEHGSKITTLENLIKSYDSNISYQTAKLEEVEKRLDNKIDALSDRVDTNSNKIATYDATIENLTNDIASYTTAIENLTNDIAALNTSCDTLSSENEDRISDINRLTYNVKNFYTEPNYTLVGDSVEIANGLWLLRVRNNSDTVETSSVSLVMDTNDDYSATFPLFIDVGTCVMAAVRSTVSDSLDQKVKLDVVKFENGTVETIDASIYATPFGFKYAKG